jgi:hypothetical protein
MRLTLIGHMKVRIELDGLVLLTDPWFGPTAGDAIGCVIAGSRTCYFSGDTRFGPGLASELAPFPLDVALVQAACAHYPLAGDDGMPLPHAAAFCCGRSTIGDYAAYLHYAGKWLDRSAGKRIEVDNATEVDAAGGRRAPARWARGDGTVACADGAAADAGRPRDTELLRQPCRHMIEEMMNVDQTERHPVRDPRHRALPVALWRGDGAHTQPGTPGGRVGAVRERVLYGTAVQS